MKRSIVAYLLALTITGSPVLGQTSEMPASARLAMPGEKHTWLDPLVGEWTVEMLVYPEAGAEPITSKDLRASRRKILDGRYIYEELRGVFAGNPSARDGILGYNNLEGRFELVTVDTFEPGQMVYAGRGDETPNKFSMLGESTEAGLGSEPSGRKRELRFEFEILDPDRNVQRIFAKFPGESEFLFVEQRFTRAQ
ncbi:MAG: DUF1579 family protein [Cyanobacteriota bacterium]|nr:DUF1579 family protein [Cyanobacteriota bacterium]